jgi:hypothetical protein
MILLFRAIYIPRSAELAQESRLRAPRGLTFVARDATQAREIAVQWQLPQDRLATVTRTASRWPRRKRSGELALAEPEQAPYTP